MRIFIIVVVVLLLVLLAIRLRTIWSRISFDFSKGFKGIDVSQFNATDLFSGGQSKVNPILSIEIKNDNSFKIPVKNLKATFYYNNTLIGDTTQELYDKHLEVPASDTLTITDAVNIYLNKAGIDILKSKATSKNVTFNYTIKLKIQILGMWIPISYTDTVDW